MPYQDSTLPHQIVLMYDKAHSNAVRVSCNCLKVFPLTGGSPHFDLMPGFPKDVAESFAIYNNPKNHRQNRGVRFAGQMDAERRTSR